MTLVEKMTYYAVPFLETDEQGAVGGKSFGRLQTLPASKGDAKTSCLCPLLTNRFTSF